MFKKMMSINQNYANNDDADISAFGTIVDPTLSILNIDLLTPELPSGVERAFQTRTCPGGTTMFESFKDAYKHCILVGVDNMLSISLPYGKHDRRILFPMRRSNTFGGKLWPVHEKRLKQLNPKYGESEKNTLFWMCRHQSLLGGLPDGADKRTASILLTRLLISNDDLQRILFGTVQDEWGQMGSYLKNISPELKRCVLSDKNHIAIYRGQLFFSPIIIY